MKSLVVCSLLIAVVFTPGCSTFNKSESPPMQVTPDHPLAKRDVLFEILRYVYLWHFDESVSTDAPGRDTIEIWVREVPVELDEGDQSRFAEVWLPQFKFLVDLKKANYSIAELQLDVRNESFKIQRVHHQSDAGAPRSDYQILTYPEKEIREHLLSTRHLKRFPDDVLRRNLRSAMIRHGISTEDRIAGDQVMHVSPISPVSNDLWVYHENLKHLIRFAADMDLSNPDYWDKTPIHVDLYDLETAVVVMNEETFGSDAYLTKDFTGRVIFNCVVLGLRIEIPEAEAMKVLEEAESARSQ